jgi:hypothetical protein
MLDPENIPYERIEREKSLREHGVYNNNDSSDKPVINIFGLKLVFEDSSTLFLFLGAIVAIVLIAIK